MNQFKFSRCCTKNVAGNDYANVQLKFEVHHAFEKGKCDLSDVYNVNVSKLFFGELQ